MGNPQLPPVRNPAPPRPGTAPTTAFDELGRRLIALGEAMRNSRSTIETLVPLAHACGIRLQLRLVGDQHPDHDEVSHG